MQVNRVANLKTIGVVCGVLLLFLSLGCGSSSRAQIRFMNAAPNTSSSQEDLLINSNKVASAIAYGTASSYTTIGAGTQHVQVEPTGTTTPIVDENLTFTASSQSTIVLFSSPTIATVVFPDNNAAPSAGNMNLRIINGSPALGAADVYVVAPGTNLSTVSPTVSGLAVQTASSYFTLTPGTYEVYFTAAGNKFALIDSGPQTWNAGQVRTVVGLDGEFGGYASTVLPDLN
jgi:hypothetical protein